MGGEVTAFSLKTSAPLWAFAIFIDGFCNIVAVAGPVVDHNSIDDADLEPHPKGDGAFVFEGQIRDGEWRRARLDLGGETRFGPGFSVPPITKEMLDEAAQAVTTNDEPTVEQPAAGGEAVAAPDLLATAERCAHDNMPCKAIVDLVAYLREERRNAR